MEGCSPNTTTERDDDVLPATCPDDLAGEGETPPMPPMGVRRWILIL